MRGIFVTGTDTGVGKTLVSTGILGLAREHGTRVRPFKPAETGGLAGPEDARALWEAAGRPGVFEDHFLYHLAEPMAPAAAAERAGVDISFSAIAARAKSLADSSDGVLVEGAGGLLVPYSGDLTTADLIQSLGLPVVLVGRAALGTVNHTTLSLNELARRAIPVLAVILTQAQRDPTPDAPTQIPLIRRLTGYPTILHLPHLPEPTSSQAAKALADAGLWAHLHAVFRS